MNPTTSEILFLILGASGLSYIVTKSYIFEWLRKLKFINNNRRLHKLFNCPLCFGFWAFPICLGISLIPYVGWYIVYSLCAAQVSRAIFRLT